MTGTPCLCAASTIEAAICPLCGATIKTSTPFVSRLSHCLVWTASSPLATCISHSAPTSLQRASTRALSRCQRSSFSVSMEKPIRTGPPCFADRPLFAWSGLLTQALNSKVAVRQHRINLTLALISLRSFFAISMHCFGEAFCSQHRFFQGPDVYSRPDQIIQAISCKITNFCNCRASDGTHCARFNILGSHKVFAGPGVKSEPGAIGDRVSTMHTVRVVMHFQC